jgi:hypothetical protein
MQEIKDNLLSRGRLFAIVSLQEEYRIADEKPLGLEKLENATVELPLLRR